MRGDTFGVLFIVERGPLRDRMDISGGQGGRGGRSADQELGEKAEEAM